MEVPCSIEWVSYGLPVSDGSCQNPAAPRCHGTLSPLFHRDRVAFFLIRFRAHREIITSSPNITRGLHIHSFTHSLYQFILFYVLTDQIASAITLRNKTLIEAAQICGNNNILTPSV